MNDNQWTELSPQPDTEWFDCTVGPFACACGAVVGMLDGMDDPQHCESCGRAFRLRVVIEVAGTIEPRSDAGR